MTREPGRAAEPSVEDLVPAGTPIDLDNCAREPIHIPGSIQPRGVLAVVDTQPRTLSAAELSLLRNFALRAGMLLFDR